MGRNAENVYTTPEDIARLQALVVALPSQARVRLTMRGGNTITGTVTERPAAQQFEDASGAPGMNALLRMGDSAVPDWSVYLWLGDIEHVRRLIES